MNGTVEPDGWRLTISEEKLINGSSIETNGKLKLESASQQVKYQRWSWCRRVTRCHPSNRFRFFLKNFMSFDLRGMEGKGKLIGAKPFIACVTLYRSDLWRDGLFTRPNGVSGHFCLIPRVEPEASGLSPCKMKRWKKFWNLMADFL